MYVYIWEPQYIITSSCIKLCHLCIFHMQAGDHQAFVHSPRNVNFHHWQWFTFLSYVNLSTNSVFQSFWFLFYCQEHKSSFFCIYYIFTLKILSVITWFLNGENIRQLLLWHSLKYVCSLFCKICIITILQWKRAVCKEITKSIKLKQKYKWMNTGKSILYM